MIEAMLKIERMPEEELPAAWESMVKEFPDDERKPLEMLRQQTRQGLMEPWWLMEDGQRRGYAMLLAAPGERMVLLDYLAMLEKGKGYGSACLRLLQQAYPGGLLVESEAEEPGLEASEEEKRRRRLGFYRRGGFAPCRWSACVYGVTYRILGWFPCPPSRWEDRGREAYCTLYRNQVPRTWLRSHFAILEDGQDRDAQDKSRSAMPR
jgi:hypothetical protein